MFHLPGLLKSLKHAFRGLGIVFYEEQNFRIHAVCALIVFMLGIFLRIRTLEWAIVALAVSFLLILEIINTNFEKVADVAKPRLHHSIAFIKDTMAAAVFLSAMIAAFTVIMVFAPYIAEFLSLHTS